MGEISYFAMFLAVGAAWVALLMGPVGQAIARRIAGKRAEPETAKTGLSTGEMAAERITEVEARLAELESRQDRLLELEERLDFAERLLTSGRVADPAPDRIVTPH